MKAVLFDLDGTLLPMDNEIFTKTYFGLLTAALKPCGYEHDKLIGAVWTGTKAMVNNDGTATNEARFWDAFCAVFGEKARDDIPIFDRFYETDFCKAREVTGSNPLAKEAVKAAGFAAGKVILATNPIFPRTAVINRLGWVGLKETDFDFITTYETSHYCKPNPLYYIEIAEIAGVSPEDCLMIGNDAHEDIEASVSAGMKAYQVTDCAIGRSDGVSGSFSDMTAYLKGL